jgi:murein DD-endopeptidase MepM/ murein hydrolase activator NlpD
MYPIRTARKYDPANLAATANIYTTVYLGTYIEGDFLEGNGSHLGVDIIPMTPHDTVMAALSGTVTKAESNAMNGNYVVIRHDGVPDPDDFSRTATLHSIYLHLDSLAVTAGATVSE